MQSLLSFFGSNHRQRKTCVLGHVHQTREVGSLVDLDTTSDAESVSVHVPRAVSYEVFRSVIGSGPAGFGFADAFLHAHRTCRGLVLRPIDVYIALLGWSKTGSLQTEDISLHKTLEGLVPCCSKRVCMPIPNVSGCDIPYVVFDGTEEEWANVQKKIGDKNIPPELLHFLSILVEMRKNTLFTDFGNVWKDNFATWCSMFASGSWAFEKMDVHIECGFYAPWLDGEGRVNCNMGLRVTPSEKTVQEHWERLGVRMLGNAVLSIPNGLSEHTAEIRSAFRGTHVLYTFRNV